MWGKIHFWLRTLALVIALLSLAGFSVTLLAQDQDPEEEPEEVEIQDPLPKLYITGNDVTNPPNIILHVYGRDLEGRAIDFNEESLTVTHDGITVIPTLVDTFPSGTFTVFLIDIPTGVEEQLPAIQEAIKQFASPGSGMQEQIDTVAIFQVGETEAKQLLAPDTFYNSVQNFFADDLVPETEATALIDSIGSMIDQMEQLNTDSNRPAALVVMSDGTDVVSTQFTASDILTRTAGLELPIHTVWVDSADLTFAGQEQGQEFLQSISDGSNGIATTLDDSEGLAEIWNHIAGFREQARVQYAIDNLTGGAFDVELSLTNNPAVTASTIVEMPDNQPQVVLNIGGNEMTLPDLEDPVQLRLGASVSWLDGLERELDSLTLFVNGQEVAEIPVEEANDFAVEISNLQYGPNNIELVVVDDQGLQATNLPATLTVNQGDQDIPEDLRPSRNWGSIIFDIFLVLVVLGVLVGIIYWFRRSKRMPVFFPKGRSKPQPGGVTYASGDASPEAMTAMEDYGRPVVQAHLEVLESITEMPQRLDLSGPVIRLGRSPAQSDIAFREDLTVSRQHANLMLEGSHYRIFDEGSTSGTWVNGRQVPEYGVELVNGDEIHLGAVHLLFREG
ncbi:MAG: FHA domain-containing protein [Candidatus Promineifilaceae bacterium]|nr:FHA domain-containing protein [Candidatus Promineifilaceae bacterium]